MKAPAQCLSALLESAWARSLAHWWTANPYSARASTDCESCSCRARFYDIIKRYPLLRDHLPYMRAVSSKLVKWPEPREDTKDAAKALQHLQETREETGSFCALTAAL